MAFDTSCVLFDAPTVLTVNKRVSERTNERTRAVLQIAVDGITCTPGMFFIFFPRTLLGVAHLVEKAT